MGGDCDILSKLKFYHIHHVLNYETRAKYIPVACLRQEHSEKGIPCDLWLLKCVTEMCGRFGVSSLNALMQAGLTSYPRRAPMLCRTVIVS